jgi:hypothetical protein
MRGSAEVIVKALDEAAGATPAPSTKRVAVKLQLLDLTLLKAKLGPRWMRSERTIHMLVESCIRRACTHQDRWGRSADDEYLLFLHDTSEAAGKEFCDAVLEDLTIKLFGTGEVDDRPNFSVNLLSLGPNALFGGASARLQAIAASRSIYTLRSNEAKNAQTMANARGEAKSKTVREEPTIIGTEDIEALVHLADKDTRTWQNEETSGRSGSLSSRKSGFEVEGVFLPHQNRGVGYSFSYTPIWDRAKRALLCYRINFSISMPQGMPVDSASPDFMALIDRSTIKAIDMLRVKRALGSLMKSHRRGIKYLVSIPVSAQSCSARWGVPTIFEQLTGFPKELGKLVLIDVMDADRPEFRAAIGEIIAAAGRHARQSLLRLGSNYEGGLLSGTAARPVGIGIDVADHDTDERELMKFLDRLAEEVTGKDASTFIWGADSTSAAMMAIAAGVTYVGGSAVAPDVADPAGVSMLGLSDIFA